MEKSPQSPAVSEVKRTGSVRMHIRIPRPVHDQVKRRARSAGVGKSRWIERAIEQRISREDAAAVARFVVPGMEAVLAIATELDRAPVRASLSADLRCVVENMRRELAGMIAG